eukprot:m.100988 g.100988  ORF g.100988 m.100988 type:complete len:307 (-) comp27294_c0_seq1:70-990(-)
MALRKKINSQTAAEDGATLNHIGATEEESKHKPWPGILGRAGRWVFNLNHHLPIVPDETSKVKSSWFIDPEQTFLEFTGVSLWILSYLYGYFTMGIRGWAPSEGHVPKPVDNVDLALAAIVFVHGAAIFTFKMMRGRVWFMLQPCNLSTWMLLWICVSRTETATWWFNFYIHGMWGSWLGLMAADLRDYNNNLEIMFFITMHVLIIGLPYLWIARGTFPIYESRNYDIYMMMMLLHFWIYLPVSLLSGWHINYMMQPPTQLRLVGKFYRWIMSTAGLIFTVLTREGMQYWIDYCNNTTSTTNITTQ